MAKDVRKHYATILLVAEELWRIPRHREQRSQRCVRYAECGLRSAVPLRATRSRLFLSRHRLLRRSDNPGMNAIHCCYVKDQLLKISSFF